MTTELSRFAGWSAYVSGAAAVLVFVAIGFFFAGVQPFGPLNDLLLVVIALAMIVFPFWAVGLGKRLSVQTRLPA